MEVESAGIRGRPTTGLNEHMIRLNPWGKGRSKSLSPVPGFCSREEGHCFLR